MIKRYCPIALIVISNVAYHICAKEVPSDMDAFASLTVTYASACAASFICIGLFRKYTSGDKGFFESFRDANWTPYALALIVFGLEFGWIIAYKAGWQISMGYIIVTSVVCGLLLFIGYFLYKEKITRNKVIGIALCLAGLVLINI